MMKKENLTTVLIGSATAVAVVLGVTLIAVAIKKNTVKSTTKTVSAQTMPETAKDVKIPLANKQILRLVLPQEQVVVLAGEIGENAAIVAQAITIKALNRKPLFLLINSPGGSVMDGALIISAIESVDVPVYTVCMQLCASMAAIIHQYGTERLMLDRSVLMFHDAAGGFSGYLPHIKSEFATIERYISRFNVYISARTGMKLDELERREHTQMWIDAEDSVATKFADSLTYVDVYRNNKPVDLNSLLKSPKKPKAAVPAVPATPPTFFDVTL